MDMEVDETNNEVPATQDMEVDETNNEVPATQNCSTSPTVKDIEIMTENNPNNSLSDSEKSCNKSELPENLHLQEIMDSTNNSSKQTVQENNDEPSEIHNKEAIKRRRRSTFLPPPGGCFNSPKPTEDKSKTHDTELPLDDTKSAKTGSSSSRRKSAGNRRSMCAVLPPMLTIAEQVSNVPLAADNSSSASSRVLCQLLDISIRDPLSKLCHLHPANEQYAALKGVVMLNSEQLAEDTSHQMTKENIDLPQLAAKCRKLDKENVGPTQTKEPGAGAVTKGLEHKSSTSSQDKYKQWLLSEYGARMQRLKAEYREWKQLRRSRVEGHLAGRREYAEACNGGGNRIGEEQHAMLSPAQRTFLAAAPDYSAILRSLAGAVEQSGVCAADYEKAVSGLEATRLTAQAVADRAYYLTEAAVYSGTQATLRCHLQQLTTEVDLNLTHGEDAPLGAPISRTAILTDGGSH